jgi:hypothetical protein
MFGPSSSQSFLSGTDLTRYTSTFTDFFGQDVTDSDPYAVLKHPDFHSPPLIVRRDRQDPQPSDRYIPS